MITDINKSILRSLLINKDVGTIITSRKYKKLGIWKDELIPYLDKLAHDGYIKGFWKKMGIKFKIIKPISLKTINEL